MCYWIVKAIFFRAGEVHYLIAVFRYPFEESCAPDINDFKLPPHSGIGGHSTS